MPYKAFHEHGKYVVRIHDEQGRPTGKSFGTHNSEEEANAQIRAIEMSEHKKELDTETTDTDNLDKFTWQPGDFEIIPAEKEGPEASDKLSPNDPLVEYDPLGGEDGQACANCKFFHLDSNSCDLVAGEIQPTGKSLLWTKQDLLTGTSPGSKERQGIVQTLRSIFSDVFGKTSASLDLSDMSSGFKSFGENGQFWVAYWGNNAKDLDREWFADAANKEYVEAVDSGAWPLPELWYWHEPHALGKALLVDKVDHVMMAVGKFAETRAGDKMREFFRSTKEAHGVSHGFLFPKNAHYNGIYYKYRTFEISPLPANVAANPYTAFEVKEHLMDAKKEKQLIEILGEDLAKEVIQGAQSRSKQLDTLGVDFKSKEDNGINEKFAFLADAMVDMASGVKELTKVVNDLTAQKEKKGEEGSDEEEATESESEAKSEGDDKKKPPFGKKQKKVTPVATPPAAPTLEQQVASIAAGMKQLQDFVVAQYQTETPASRSPLTVIPPDNPQLNMLMQKMTGQGAKNLPPGQQVDPMNPQVDYSSLLFPSLFSDNGDKA